MATLIIFELNGVFIFLLVQLFYQEIDGLQSLADLDVKDAGQKVLAGVFFVA